MKYLLLLSLLGSAIWSSGCGGGQCGDESLRPKGYQSDCSGPADCPDGLLCLEPTTGQQVPLGQPGVCTIECSSDEDCPLFSEATHFPCYGKTCGTVGCG